MTAWALPENIEDILPADAGKLERMRRTTLDIFASHGYQLVMPPMLEYVESLLSGVGRDMDLATFKLVDQLSGRMMGLRADTTPQVARIDAHVLNRDGVTRLCYAGSVLHTRPSGLGKSRQPFQVGAELYGHAGIDADIEVQQLMLETLAAFGIHEAKIDIGHSEIFRALVDDAGVSSSEREMLFAAVTAKDIPALNDFSSVNGGRTSSLAALPGLYGYGADSATIIKRARRELPNSDRVMHALDELEQVVAYFMSRSIGVSIDLSELGGFNYESGIAFAAYVDGASDAVGRGGRYDDIGRVFGRARPATGFSMDLKALLPLVPDKIPKGSPILAPKDPDESAVAAMTLLRCEGEVVIKRLENSAIECDRELKLLNGQWQVVPIKDKA